MTIWVGHDGTLNDDEGDGPAVAGDPMEALVGYGYPGAYPGYYGGYPGFYPGYYVGQDDFGSALGSIGSALGSALGGSGGAGGGGGGGGGGGFDFGSLASSFGSAFGGSGQGGGGGGDTGSQIANIFGQVAKAAAPVAAQAISSAAQPHPQAQAQAQTQAPAQPPAQHPAAQHPAAQHPPAQHPAAQPQHARQTSADPKARLGSMLTSLGRKYGMQPPAGGVGGAGSGGTLADVGSFVQKMMAPSGTSSGTATATTGYYAGDLGDLLGDASASLGRAFSHPPISRSYQRRSPDFGLQLPSIQLPSIHFNPTYPAHSPGRGYSAPQQQYAPPQRQYAQPQHQYAPQPLPGYSDYQGYQAPTPQGQPPVSYQSYPMPQPQPTRQAQPQPARQAQTQAQPVDQKKWSAWAMEVGPITVSHPDDNLKPGKVGKFVSKMMGGPGATTAKAPDEYVRAAQQVLNQYYATQVLKEDGIMGNETHRILKWFQKQNGLPETGDIDPATRTALASRLAERAGQQGGLQPGGDDPTSDSSWLISRIHAQDTATSGFWPNPYYGMW